MRPNRLLTALLVTPIAAALAAPQWALARGFGSSRISFSPSVRTFLVVVILVVLAGETYFNKGKNKWLSSAKTVPPPVRYASPSEWALKDPHFNERRFVERVTAAFFKIKKAWSDADMASARALVSDAVYSGFAVQLEQHKNNGVCNKLDMLRLDRCSLAEIRTEGGFDMADVEIDATAEEHYVDAQTGECRSGSRKAVTWRERWTFMRSVHALTDETKGVIADTCPICRAPLTIDAVGACGHCGNSVVNGQFDWVLSQITSLDEAG